MKKKMLFSFFLIGLITLLIVDFEKVAYSIETRNFEKITIEELYSIRESEDNITVYIGRSTCPYCRVFVPKLNNAVKNHNSKVYYINSELGVEGSEDLEVFRAEHKLETVPALLKVRSGNIEAIMDSSMSEEEILDFIDL